MNASTHTMNKGAVAASRSIDTIAALPGRICRAPGKAIRTINSGVYHFTNDFRALRAEVKAEKERGARSVEKAIRELDEVRKEKALTLKRVEAVAAENIRLSKDKIEKTRTSSRRRVALATERMADQKAINRMEREAAEIQSRITGYETRIQELEEQRRYARRYSSPVEEAVSKEEVAEGVAKFRAEVNAPMKEKKPQPSGEGFQALVKQKAETPASAATEEAAAPEGVGSLLKAASAEAPAPEFHSETGEDADAGEEPAAAGVPLKDEEDDDKL